MNLSGQAVYLETNFFIKAVEGAQEASGAPKKLLASLRARPGIAVTSELTFAETLAPTQRPDALPFSTKRRAYLDLLLWSGFITLIPVSREILIDTADLRAVNRMKLPDAIHLASAIHGKCRYVVSADGDFDKLPEGMTRVEPNDEGIDNLMKALS